jgi:hypothetical protein
MAEQDEQGEVQFKVLDLPELTVEEATMVLRIAQDREKRARRELDKARRAERRKLLNSVSQIGQVRSFIRDHGPATVKEIADATLCSNIYVQMSKMLQRGEVVRDEDGHYTLTEQGLQRAIG